MNIENIDRANELVNKIRKSEELIKDITYDKSTKNKVVIQSSTGYNLLKIEFDNSVFAIHAITFIDLLISSINADIRQMKAELKKL